MKKYSHICDLLIWMFNQSDITVAKRGKFKIPNEDFAFITEMPILTDEFRLNLSNQAMIRGLNLTFTSTYVYVSSNPRVPNYRTIDLNTLKNFFRDRIVYDFELLERDLENYSNYYWNYKALLKLADRLSEGNSDEE